ncbi:sulfite exporter TauE/SafE family protein [Succinatimonas hippei]|uniref:sulfite exporter TauE/SafE family protein n=1 Tax=Succinatimonas hippei TaxID=626938 RepID=UPI00248F985E|nr:sulfite exporter TauE/SafE family protein [Succinatimonas hippei]
MSFATICFLLGCGVFTNLMSALFGIGGGVLMVPLLMTVFPQFSMQMVAATSLSIVIGSALINLTYFIRQKIAISYKGLVLWSAGMIIGVQGGFELSFIFHPNVIVGIFIVTMLILAVKTFLKLKKSYQVKEEVKVNAKDLAKGTLFCTLGGFIAGITGIGGGSIMSPLVNQLSFVKQHQVAVYTNYMMVIGGVGSMIGYLSKPCKLMLENTFQVGYVNFTLVGIVIVGSFITSFVSMRLRGKLKRKLADLLLGLILLFVAGYTLVVYLL